MPLTFAFLLISAQIMTSQGIPQATAPDTVFLHGNIYTGESSNGTDVGQFRRVEAMAVSAGRVVAVGSDSEIMKLKRQHTIVVDLGGGFVMPGFNDAHLHLAEAGLEKLNVNLLGSKSLADMQARIAERVKTAQPGEWIIGGGWDHTTWREQKLPTRFDLDVVTGNHPAVFSRVDGHISVANSAALRAAGILKPPGTAEAAKVEQKSGKIDRDSRGEPTGILRETARDLADRKVPPPTPAQRRKALSLALEDAASWGITSAQDNSSWEDFLVYEELEREGELTLRISEWLPFTAPLEILKQHRAAHPSTDLWLRTGMLKGFMDGSLGSRTAALQEPYSDDPGNTGLPQFTQATLNTMTAERLAAGFQIGFHAIGDEAVEMALGAFAYGISKLPAPPAGLPLRIEHAQVIDPQQFETFKHLGVIASMQPNHLLTDMNWAESRIGPQRARNSYPWKKFLDSGVPLAFGTDYPVEPITPFRGLYAAVTRKNEAGTREYYPEEKLTIAQAIHAYTVGSAYAEFAENDKGTLAPGKVADFAVLDRDITRIAPPEILKTRVLRTVVGGKTVYLGR